MEKSVLSLCAHMGDSTVGAALDILLCYQCLGLLLLARVEMNAASTQLVFAMPTSGSSTCRSR